jgi:hypothetical protein
MKALKTSARILLVIEAVLVFIFSMSACTSTQISSALKTTSDYMKEDQALSTGDVIAGLKEALVKGAEYSTASASKTDGYLKNLEIKIPFPPEIEKIETTLRNVGLNKPVDDFIMSINRAAEQAAIEAKPLFVSAITSMTIEDAWGILKGDNHAATTYLRKTTSSQLAVKFEPIIDNALNKVNATKYYEDMSTQYNRIPFVTKVETDLTKYVGQKAIDGLFVLVAKEEEKIRKDPLARTTELLKRVFADQ